MDSSFETSKLMSVPIIMHHADLSSWRCRDAKRPTAERSKRFVARRSYSWCPGAERNGLAATIQRYSRP